MAIENRLGVRIIRDMANNDDFSFPDRSKTALLLIDVINDLEFDSGEAVLEQALPMAEQIVLLKQRARAQQIPVVYLNDNFGQWRSDFRSVVSRNMEDVRGAPLVRRLAPDETDYFVLKPKHSGFYDTTLRTLLRFLGTERLILTGIATEMCVLFTAMDAYMRDYKLAVPRDCVASKDEETRQAALDYMAKVLKADTASAADLELHQSAQSQER